MSRAEATIPEVDRVNTAGVAVAVRLQRPLAVRLENRVAVFSADIPRRHSWSCSLAGPARLIDFHLAPFHPYFNAANDMWEVYAAPTELVTNGKAAVVNLPVFLCPSGRHGKKTPDPLTLHTRIAATLVSSLLLRIALLTGLLAAIGTRASAFEEKRFDLRDSQFDNAALRLAPAGTSRLVVPEADGLRMMIPAAARVDEVGIQPRVGLRGDFEIIVTYEIIKIAPPKSGYGCGPRIYISTATEDEQAATISRMKRVKEGDSFCAHSARYVAAEQGERQRQHVIHIAPAAAGTGRLCLRRTGKDLHWLADDAERDVLIERHTAPFTDADVSYVQISLHRGGAKTAADARWKEVILRADEFVGGRDANSGGWLLALGGLLAGAVVAIGVWYYRRAR
ncbi:MAG: DUF1583 domain-containing protein [Rhodopirellula sp.]|nr:DUF1583 domain-containing protein [Rhodopirellula sp.]